MIAIETKFIGPTTTKPARIKAYTCAGQSLTLSKDALAEHAGDRDYNVHLAAAEALRDKLDWTGELLGGGTQTGFAFVFELTKYDHRNQKR